MKRFFLLAAFIFIVFFLGRSALNPFKPMMFDFHDNTQAARIDQFVLNLKNFKIPPRIAPDFSHRLGFPVFNYYAPAAYWISSVLKLSGLATINVIKLSFLLAIAAAAFFMFKLLNYYFGFYPALLGSLLYASSPWLAIEIFIRGNLAEAWFLALMPLAFYMAARNAKTGSKTDFILTVLSFSLALTAHNVLSIVLLFLLVSFIFINGNKIRNFSALILSLLLSAYYFIPAILELSKTYAASSVYKTNLYVENLLCPWQLWTTPFWGYGASTPDCQDGMPFMLGKPQILTAVVGLVLFFISFKSRNDRQKKAVFFMSGLVLVSVFLSTNVSFLVSTFLKPVLSFFQFPWRFSSFSLFGLAFLAGAVSVPKSFRKYEIVLAVLGLSVVFYNSKFFTKALMPNTDYNRLYVSTKYVTGKAAYDVSEYLPTSADYEEWRLYEPKKDQPYKIDPYLEDGKFIHSPDGSAVKISRQQPFSKQAWAGPGKIILNVSYLPYWKILLDGAVYIPHSFDKFGRPVIELSKQSEINVIYEQTGIEKAGNAITLLTLSVLMIVVLFNRSIDKNMKKLKNEITADYGKHQT